jgi:hypothetical protein
MATFFHMLLRAGLLFVLLVGCAGTSEPGTLEQESVPTGTLIRCAGTLPETPVTFVYRGTADGGEVWDTTIDVFMAGERGTGASETGEVSVQLDFSGEENGGSFLFYPLGAMLAVEYSDPDGDVRWSMPACFDAP